jgi:acetoin utilization deacetylase AcuC-like enzyme
MEIADASANGRVVSLLEGGYDLQGLANSAAAHVTALMRG